MLNEVVIGGVYRHFKGWIVRVLALGKDSETTEDLVIYRHEGEESDGEIWVRPLTEFVSDVDKQKYPECKQVKRFEFLRED